MDSQKIQELHQEFLKRDKELLQKLGFKIKEIKLEPAPLNQFLIKKLDKLDIGAVIAIVGEIEDNKNYVQTLSYILDTLYKENIVDNFNFILFTDIIPLPLLSFLNYLANKKNIKIFTTEDNYNKFQKLEDKELFEFLKDKIFLLNDAEKEEFIQKENK